MCCVPEHVEGVCDEGHGVGDVPDDDLDEEEAARQPEHGDEAALLARVPTHGDGGLRCGRRLFGCRAAMKSAELCRIFCNRFQFRRTPKNVQF